MTDKQIIIKRIRDCDNCKFRPETSKVCSDYENCYMVSEYICNLRKQLKAKEQECEELKRQHQGDKGLITSTGKMNYQLLQEYDKLKTALTEIKEIARVGAFYWKHYKEESKRYNEILQKINEVE